jgi:polyisoprenoid-binding protein YceI
MTTVAERATRVAKGTEVPAAGTWRVDPGHAEVGFVGRHLMFTKVRGRFTDVEAVIEIGEDLADSRVEATIRTASLDSGFGARDEHLKSADYFDVENHPEARFRSTGFHWEGGSRGVLRGELTIKGVTREIELVVDYLGFDTDPWNNQRAVFSAHGTLNREDWGLTWNMVLESGSLLVSREIELVLEFEAVRDSNN